MSEEQQQQQPTHRFLVQMLFRYLGAMDIPCPSTFHVQAGQEVSATWEARFYQDTELLWKLHDEGVSKEHMDQALWDAACHEQDTIGVQRHQSLPLCTECVEIFAERHGGEVAAVLTLTTAQITYGAFLIVSERATERAFLVGNVRGNVKDEEILTILRNGEHIDLRFKE